MCFMNAKLVKFLRFLAPCSAITCIAGYVVHAQLSHVRPGASGSKRTTFDQLLTSGTAHVGTNGGTGDFGLLQYEIEAAAESEHRAQKPSQKELEDMMMASSSKSAPVFDFRATSFAPLRIGLEPPAVSRDQVTEVIASSSKSMAVFTFRPPTTGEVAKGNYFTSVPTQQTNTIAQGQPRGSK